MSTSEWPPSSLEDSTCTAIIQECENRTVSGMIDATTLQVHMAALLYDHNWTAARHVWRLWRDEYRADLEPLWRIAAFQMEWKIQEAFAAIDALQHPYAAALSQAYHRFLSQAPPYYRGLLGLEEIRVHPKTASVTDVVSFLENKTA